MIRGISAGLDHRRRVEMQIQSFTGIHLPLRLENSLALIVLEKGKLFVELDDNRTMLSAPALLCLHDRRRLRASRQEDAAGSILQFNPTFLNASMTTCASPALRSWRSVISCSSWRPSCPAKSTIIFCISTTAR